MDLLPIEVLAYLLEFLPTVSIKVKCRAVSRHWRNCIDHDAQKNWICPSETILTSFQRGCERGNLPAVIWLTRVFSLNAVNARAKNNEALYQACINGRLAITQWLVGYFCLTFNDFRTRNDIMQNICRRGHLAVAQWLAEAFSLTKNYIRNCGALQSACADGQLAVAQWLVETFRLTAADDASILGNKALYSACANDELAIAQWLVETFRLTAEGTRIIDTRILMATARANGDTAVVQWLVATFGLTANVARGRKRKP
jgi:hypothetical protein